MTVTSGSSRRTVSTADDPVGGGPDDLVARLLERESERLTEHLIVLGDDHADGAALGIPCLAPYSRSRDLTPPRFGVVGLP